MHFKIVFHKMLLRRVLSNACPERFSYQDEKGKRTCCYIAKIKATEPYFLALRIVGNTVEGLKFDGEHFSVKSSICLIDFIRSNYVVKRHFGCREWIYENHIFLAINLVIPVVDFQFWFRDLFVSIWQHVYNSRSLVTRRKLELLKFMVEKQIGQESKNGYHFMQPAGTTLVDLATDLHSYYFWRHPDHDSQLSRINLYLESLKETCDIKQEGLNYIVQGKSISTIESYEIEERRHKNQFRVQLGMLLITIAILIAASIQAGVIKLPPLFDFTGKGEGLFFNV